MKILHYTLGFPPSRSGGLVEYSLSLMQEQSKSGDNVFCLYPGRINFFNNSTKIRRDKNKDNITTFELVNSLPLAIFNGIKTPEDFYEKCYEKIYFDFLDNIRVDVIHVHTLMGIHIEFFEVARKMGIPIVYTSHDYYGLFPLPSFFFNGESYDKKNTIENWVRSSSQALSTRKLRIFQLKHYPTIKKILRRIIGVSKHSNIVDELCVDTNLSNSITFEKLKDYYLKMFSMITFFHFNSSTARDVFIENIPFDMKFQVITITSIQKISGILKKTNGSKIRIGYVGPDEDYKGFFEFIELTRILNSGKFEFHTFGYDKKHSQEFVIEHGKFDRSEIFDVYSSIDILIVPSKCKETFGLIVLEALSYGVTVYVSQNVGAKDILDKSNIFIDLDDLTRKIKQFRLEESIDSIKQVKTFEKHNIEIGNIYSNLIGNKKEY